MHFWIPNMYRLAFKFMKFLWLLLLSANLSAGELKVAGTKFLLDDKPFPYTGMSFFNAIYNPAFNNSTPARMEWMRQFQSYGINVLRIWCQWDNARGFVDAGAGKTLYAADGGLVRTNLEILKAILVDADKLGICVELVLFAQESWRENIRVGEPAELRAVTELTRELKTFRNVTFQIWNEHTDNRVLPLVKLIRSIDPRRLVTNSPGGAGVLGSDEENAVLDYLTPHTTRHAKEKHWQVAPRELEGLLRKFSKPVVDDEPARNGTAQFGGPREQTSPYDHIVQIVSVWKLGAYTTYHHDMFQTGYGSPACPPSGVPDPEFNPYHKAVFDFLKLRGRYMAP
jgi:hypothetical protein